MSGIVSDPKANGEPKVPGRSAGPGMDGPAAIFVEQDGQHLWISVDQAAHLAKTLKSVTGTDADASVVQQPEA